MQTDIPATSQMFSTRAQWQFFWGPCRLRQIRLPIYDSDLAELNFNCACVVAKTNNNTRRFIQNATSKIIYRTFYNMASLHWQFCWR